MATQAPSIQETIYKFTVAQFEQMISDGIFTEDDRIELINGEVVRISPINHPHAAVVSKLEFVFREMLGRTAYVWAQQPLLLSERSRPQPDVVLLRWRDDYYAQKRPSSEDALLVIEVSDTTLPADRSTKRALYAQAGIPEYWIVNLQERLIEMYSNPIGGKHTVEKIAASGEALQLPGDLSGSITPDKHPGRDCAWQPQPLALCCQESYAQ